VSAAKVDHAARAENVRWFVETGECLTGAARRMDMTIAALEKWCEKNDMRTELARLRSRDPIDPDKSLSELGRLAAAARWAS